MQLPAHAGHLIVGDRAEHLRGRAELEALIHPRDDAVDLAAAHISAMEPGKQGFYNLGNGAGYSVREVIKTCEKISGRPIRAIDKPRRPGDPPRLVASAARAFEELHWKPRFPKLEEIVASAWSWHQKYPNGYPN